MDERQQKTAAAIAEVGADWAALTSPAAVAYATGHIVPIEAGPSPFAGGPTTALVGRDGRCAVVCANVEGAAAAVSRADVVESYEGFGFETGPDLEANYLAAFRRAQAALGLGGKAAIERVSCPLSIAEDMGDSLSITGPLARLRAIKTEAEIAALRRAAEVATVGQQAFREAAAPGRTELDVFADIRRAMENAAGERVPVTGDFISGTVRTAGFTGWPTDRVMRQGELVMSDLAPRVAGYWGDSCTTSVLGEPSEGWLAMLTAARDALMEARELIRPGLRIDELDSRLRGAMLARGHSYPHHTGHAVGTSVHEWPRVVPYETAQLAAGMVLMIAGCLRPRVRRRPDRMDVSRHRDRLHAADDLRVRSGDPPAAARSGWSRVDVSPGPLGSKRQPLGRVTSLIRAAGPGRSQAPTGPSRASERRRPH